MKKIVALVLLGIFLVTGGVLTVVNTLEAGKTTVPIQRSWDLPSTKIKSIFLDGTQQDVNLTIESTDEKVSQLLIAGKIPEESAEVLKEAEVSPDHLYLPFAKKGFRLAVSSGDKDTLDVTLRLAKSASFEEFRLETWTGNIKLTVPKTYSGKLDLSSHGGAIKNHIAAKEASNEKIVIETYGDIQVIESKE